MPVRDTVAARRSRSACLLVCLTCNYCHHCFNLNTGVGPVFAAAGAGLHPTASSVLGTIICSADRTAHAGYAYFTYRSNSSGDTAQYYTTVD